jgi:hypothetical protein
MKYTPIRRAIALARSETFLGDALALLGYCALFGAVIATAMPIRSSLAS